MFCYSSNVGYNSKKQTKEKMKKLLFYFIVFFLPLLTLELFDNYIIGAVASLLLIFFFWKINYFPENKS